MKKVLVLGASGFLGSHVTRQLVAAGHDVRIMVRHSSNISNIDDLCVEVLHFSDDKLSVDDFRRAMEGVDWVFHSIVDTRFYLHDSSSLFATNVEGLRNSMDAALDAGIERFIFTSSFSTIATVAGETADETDEIREIDIAPAYIKSRCVAERLFMEYCDNSGLDGVACCVSNTYGERDIQPTEHGNLILLMSKNRIPILWNYSIESVGVKDAAAAMILAAEKGKIGERYIISERYLSMKEVRDIVRDISSKNLNVAFVPSSILLCLAKFVAVFTRPLNINTPFHPDMFYLSESIGAMSNSKARRDLGWNPRSLNQELKEAVHFFEANPCL